MTWYFPNRDELSLRTYPCVCFDLLFFKKKHFRFEKCTVLAFPKASKTGDELMSWDLTCATETPSFVEAEEDSGVTTVTKWSTCFAVSVLPAPDSPVTRMHCGS
jgi:hypothetical protein